MKLNMKALALMGALAAGVAGAVPATSVNTNDSAAGTNINNQATASYDNPSFDKNKPSDPVTNPATNTSTSNTVVTVVMPKPQFNITFTDGTADGGNQNVITTTAETVPNATPKQAVQTPYTVVNTGNTAMRVDLKADTTGAATANGTETVNYYLASQVDASGNITGNPITFVDLPQGESGSVNIIQVVTLPDNAKVDDTYGASPVGTVQGADAVVSDTGTKDASGNSIYQVTGNGYGNGVTGNEVSTTGSTPAATYNNNEQFVKITMFTPKLTNNPDPGTTPTTPVGPGGTPITPPTNSGSTINTPTAPNGSTTDSSNPVVPGGNGYPSPNPGGNTPANPIPIAVNGDNQIAYPPSNGTGLETVTGGTDNGKAGATLPAVVFINTVTNTGGLPDTVQLYPVDAVKADGSLNTGWSFDPSTATFTAPDGSKIQFIDPTTGVPIPVATGATYPTLQKIPANGTAYYDTKISNVPVNYATGTAPVVTQIGIDSTNTAGIVTVDTTTDTIMPPAAEFGDTSALSGNTVNPSPVQNQNAQPGDTASYDMTVANTGQYSDSFLLNGHVTINGVDTAIAYYGPDGQKLPTDSNGNYITPVVASGQHVNVVGKFDVPTGTPTGVYPLTQTATGQYTKLVMTDTNDTLTVTASGSIVVGKFTNTGSTTTPNAGSQYVTGNPGKASTTAPAAGTANVTNPVGYDGVNPVNYQPRVGYDYQIIAKNTYNTDISNFGLKDTLNNNLVYEGCTVTVAVPKGTAPTPSCSYDPATGVVSTTTVTLPQGATMNLKINVHIK